MRDEQADRPSKDITEKEREREICRLSSIIKYVYLIETQI